MQPHYSSATTATSEMDTLPRMRPKCRNSETIGHSYTCQPHLAPDNLCTELPWTWFPWDLKLGVVLILQILVIVSSVIVYILALVKRSGVTAGIAAFFVLLDSVFIYLMYIINWNFKLREMICFAWGKKIQATDTWKTNFMDNHSKDRAKEVFHTEQFKGVVVYVLKDGTIEFRNKGAEFSANMGAALGLNFELDCNAAKRVENMDDSAADYQSTSTGHPV